MGFHDFSIRGIDVIKILQMKNRMDEVTKSFALRCCMEFLRVIMRFINADENIAEEYVLLGMLKVLKGNDICGAFMAEIFFIHSGHALCVYKIPAEFRFFNAHLRKEPLNNGTAERDIETKPRVKVAKG